MGKLVSFSIFLFFLIGCASGHCLGTKIDKKIKIYKPDGSLQCTNGKSVSVTDMAKELGEIKIYSQRNMSDGQMHTMACGTPTGKVNVYEINKSDFEKIKAKGFKIFANSEKTVEP